MKINGVNDLIKQYAERWGRSKGFSFLDERGEIFLVLTAEDLYSKAKQFAASLQMIGVKKGDRVALIIPEQDHFVEAFYGCMLGGFIAVPLAAPRDIAGLKDYLSFLSRVFDITQPEAIVATPKLKTFLNSLSNINKQRVYTVEEVRSEVGQFVEPDQICRAEIALLQFTSGSTSMPKGVMVSHENLIANAEAISISMMVSAEDKFCTWLPFYHDMGLIGFLITPLIVGAYGYYFSPLIFLKRPIYWLKTISKYRCSISFAPNFAYGLCTRRISNEEMAQLDLTSWKYAGCGAEPINLKTIQEFIAKFSAVGFSDKTFKPCYGLAEHTLAVTLTGANTTFRSEPVSRASISENNDVHFIDDNTSMTVVSCGVPLANHQVEIVNALGEPCLENEVGEVVASGPSVALGYYKNPEASAESFKDGRLFTGDLGFISKNELFICGRKKDLIIIAGKNYYPADIEAIVWEVDGVRKGNVIAFSVANQEGEKLVVLAEYRKGLEKGKLMELSQKARSLIVESMGISSEIVALPEGSLPKTSSGKLQRVKAKQLYLSKKIPAKSWIPKRIKNIFILLSCKR